LGREYRYKGRHDVKHSVECGEMTFGIRPKLA
jgi:hypothetical protein